MKKVFIAMLCLLFAGCASKSPDAKWDCKSYGGLLDLGRSCKEVVAKPQPAPSVSAVEPSPIEQEMAMEDPAPQAYVEEPMVEEPEPAPMSVRDQLMAMPPEHFVVQIVSMSTEENMQRFIREHDLFEKAHVRTYAKGQVWYVILYGVYEHYSEAKSALQSIPYRHQTQAWIRTVGQLQDAIRAYDEHQ